MVGNLLYKKAKRSCHSGIVAHVFCLGGNKVKSKKTKELGTRKACDISKYSVWFTLLNSNHGQVKRL